MEMEDHMADIIPVDDFIEDEWYAAYTDDPPRPFKVEQAGPLTKEDESRFWLLDFHYPKGATPLTYDVIWAGGSLTQLVADAIPLPPSRGLTVRMVGTHVYAGEVPVTSPWQMGFRAERAQRTIPTMIQNFPENWQAAVEELESGLGYFEGVDMETLPLPELAQMLDDAVAFATRAWEIHFEMMYPLLANYVGFYGICSELGIDPGEISKFLQGTDSKIMEADRELWRLTGAAREAGLEELFAANDPEDLQDALDAAGDKAAGFREQFGEFLKEFGWRTEGIVDLTLVPWMENPTSPLGTIKTFLQTGELFDFEAAHVASVAERDEAIEAARSRLTVEEQGAFDAALGACQHANFAWWNEEHNHYIDLRAHIPIRRAALAIGSATGAEDPEDTLYLFMRELQRLAAGDASWDDFNGLVAERKVFFERWLARRTEMPKVLGTVPEDMNDPVLVEIFGIGRRFLDQMEGMDPNATELTGIPASTGKVTGTARVLLSAQELHRIEPGEILVCEATSPNWTPAFGKISACVCDAGGTLTHASIVSREYRIPCVVGVGIATTAIKDGDVIEVDGSNGVIRIVERA